MSSKVDEGHGASPDADAQAATARLEVGKLAWTLAETQAAREACSHDGWRRPELTPMMQWCGHCCRTLMQIPACFTWRRGVTLLGTRSAMAGGTAEVTPAAMPGPLP